jgi:hypothetical protein
MPNPEERRREAHELAALWSRISRQHLSAGQGCACGFGGLLLQASDFEIDIVEFLINDARQAGLIGIEPYVNAVARRGDDGYNLAALFQAIAEPVGQSIATTEELDFALTRLRKTLSSMEAAHSNSRFVCD